MKKLNKLHFIVILLLSFMTNAFAENEKNKELQKIKDELLHQRATQAYLWAFPLINTLGMKVGSEKEFGAGYNVLPVWKKRLNADTLVTTPNSDVIYAMSYVNLAIDGPLVFEVPPKLQGILMDFWQRPIPVDGGKFAGDIGFFGPDEGKGGKFLILPPQYKGEIPKGYYVYRSATNNVFIFLRAFYENPNDLKPAVALIERSKIYPLSTKSPKAMIFPDASGVSVNMLPLSNLTAFEQIKNLLDEEGANLADLDSLGLLASIGIIKDKPFNPDAHSREILDKAAKKAYAASRVIGIQDNVSGRSLKAYPDRHWLNPVADATPENPAGPFDNAWNRTKEGYLDLNMRIWFFTNYYSMSPGMMSQIPGKGAKYFVGFVDSHNEQLLGENNYKLTLPANIPAANFWSVTLYDAKNGSGLANGQAFPSLGSRDKPMLNADGTMDVYFGPQAPIGKEKNWIATLPNKGYFAVLRLYSPTQPALDKTWKPGDIEKVK